ncbi:hypothetical protein FGU65_12895 [Methanoculleus sp. FWC-SCC1]|uniref:Leucine carboxyl methyltransferase n=1 Tax=Methanoculleus frigidifontis TaxID=2584085 RepID=A0ABT8MCV6_9EURY|nr:class I SAM-dependent methyltransferase [Methanoculleus sp. FWC-SCC1]MDN7025766.1 hypothetical protein [Methanoculleus sp. FWC-SCC1]
MGTILLGPTAALVMQWALPLYRHGITHRYADVLDLAAGRDLFTRCDAVCDWYGEVILNRKHCIRSLALRDVQALGEDACVIILAAGMSPLGLELVSSDDPCPSRIIEVDIAGMGEKAALYRRIDPVRSRRIRCLNADITSEASLRMLSREARGCPAIVLLEGITYYLSGRELAGILGAFHSRDAGNRFVIEYLLPCDVVNPARRHIPREIFRIIQESAGLAATRCYTHESLGRLVAECGGAVEAHYNMTAMERCRTGRNHFFPHGEDGWIVCSHGRI